MGFAESDVLDALRINGNNQDAAVSLENLNLLQNTKCSFAVV